MTKVIEAMSLMHEHYRSTLQGMLDREKLDTDAEVDAVMQHFVNGNVISNEESVALAALGGAASRANANKFGPKLNFTKHCEILGLHRLGYTAEMLSQAYGIDRRTVTHIYNTHSVKYRAVREEEKQEGLSFISKYVTPEVRAHIETFRSQPEGVNNKYATGMAGLHIVQGENCEYKHRVSISWREPPEVELAGWYYKDLDGDLPEEYFHCGEESMKNSQACYNAMLSEIMDRTLPSHTVP